MKREAELEKEQLSSQNIAENPRDSEMPSESSKSSSLT
jgi:hypothetical protein